MEELRVLYEEDDFLAVYKPVGMLMHGFLSRKSPASSEIQRGEQIVNGVGETLADWVRVRYPETGVVGDDPGTRPGIVHRLDRDTSGVVLVARTQAAFDYFKALFQSGKISKTYLALVSGKLIPKEGIIERPISLKPGTTRRTIHGGKMTKFAVTHYKVLRYRGCDEGNGDQCVSLVEAYPKTGRTHQIRVHMASTGHPIAGDVLYGKKPRLARVSRLMLHAFALEFTTPSGNRIRVEAEPPQEFFPYLAGR